MPHHSFAFIISITVSEDVHANSKPRQTGGTRPALSGRELRTGLFLVGLYEYWNPVSMNKAIVTIPPSRKRRRSASQQALAVSQLALGVALEFNNILTIIVGNCDLLLLDHQRGDNLALRTDEIKRAAQRAVNVTERLLALSGSLKRELHVLDLNLLVQHMERMLQPLLEHGIRLKTILSPSPVCVNAEANQIEQVLTHLVVNALEAMPDGGTVTIRTSIQRGRSGTNRSPEKTIAAHGLVSVSDTGSGISPEARPRLFEPFFTTKTQEMRIGLGLTICQGIVGQSGGRIAYKTQEARGSTFSVFLPAARSN